MNIKIVKIIGMATTIAGAGITIISDWVQRKEIEDLVEKKVIEALINKGLNI